MAQYQSTTTANTGGAASLAVNKPSGLAVGDLLFAQTITRIADARTTTPPVGWTQIRQDSTSYLFYKLADSADVAASTFTFTFSAGVAAYIRLTRISNVSPTTPVDQNNGTFASGGDFNISGSGITPTTPTGLMLISIMGDFNNARTVSGYSIATDNPTWTEVGEGVVESGLGIALAYATRPQTTATSTVSASFNLSTQNRIIQILNLNSTVDTDVIALAAPIVPQASVDIMAGMFGVVPGFFDAVATGVANHWSNTAKSVATWDNKPKT